MSYFRTTKKEKKLKNESDSLDGLSHDLDSNIEKSDSGFGSVFSNANVRLMNPDGSLNVRVKGLNRFNDFSFYYRFMRLSTINFYLTLLLIYIAINALFASIYYFLGSNSLNLYDGHATWLDDFFFSTQTFTTVGYGSISPNSLLANIVSSFEAFIGLLSFAIATGLVYGRFSSSKTEIKFSKNILLTKLDDVDSLTLRLVNISETDLSDVSAQIIMSWIEMTESGMPLRKFKSLELEINTITMLTTSWTLVHKVSDDSPCQILKTSEGHKGLEFMVFLKAFDEAFDQVIKARTSYLEKDMIKSARFVPITSYVNHYAEVDLDKLDLFDYQ